MMQNVERYMKQAIVDKLPSVSSAALTSSIHLMRQSPEIVKRWGQRSSRSHQSREHHDSIPCSRSALSDPSTGQTRHSKTDRQVLQRRSSKSLRLLFSREIISANLSTLVSVFRFALPLVWSTKKAKGNDERENESCSHLFPFAERTVRRIISSIRVWETRTTWSSTKRQRRSSRWNALLPENSVRRLTFFHRFSRGRWDSSLEKHRGRLTCLREEKRAWRKHQERTKTEMTGSGVVR